MVGREEEASELGDRHQGQVSPGKGRGTSPALTGAQQRGWHLDQGSTPPATISERTGGTRSHSCLRMVGLTVTSR